MSRDNPYNEDFEMRLVNAIEAYWAARGHIVRAWLEGPPNARYPRSNLLNGLPHAVAMERRELEASE